MLQNLKYLEMHGITTKEEAAPIPEAWLSSHTMLDALYYYVCQKFPMKGINRLLSNGACVEIHGTYPTTAKEVLKEKGYIGVKQIPFSNNAEPKKLNYVRPSFFEAYNQRNQLCLIAAVTPGADYIAHYTSMLQYIFSMKGVSDKTKTFNVRYPLIEKSLCEWSGLNSKFVSEGDKVVIGYVEQLQNYLTEKTNLRPFQTNENAFYTSARFDTGSEHAINFLGVKYSFWGNASAELTRKVCSHGATELLYLSKVGALSSCNDLYTKLFIPTNYIVLRDGCSVDHIDIENSMSTEPLHQGGHVSVPTVLEETFRLREIVSAAGAHSIDNEVSQIAAAIKDYNSHGTTETVKFGSAHFATDYLHEDGNKKKNRCLNLSSNRTTTALTMKRLALSKLSKKLLHHLQLEPVHGVCFGLPLCSGSKPPQLQ